MIHLHKNSDKLGKKKKTDDKKINKIRKNNETKPLEILNSQTEHGSQCEYACACF